MFVFQINLQRIMLPELSISQRSTSLATAVGFIDYEKPLYLIVSSEMLAEPVRVLREIGVDNIAGYFDADEVVEAGLAIESYEFKMPDEVVDQIKNGDAVIVDVRGRAEWNGTACTSSWLFIPRNHAKEPNRASHRQANRLPMSYWSHEGWQQGDAVIVPPPQTAQEAEERINSLEFDCKDWYFCTRKLTDR